jgi:carbon-monoxide dehydrogenase large subunit
MTQSRETPVGTGGGTGIGASIPRLELPRLAAGRGRYVDDIVLPRMVHAVFVRSPHAHARLLSIDSKEARRQPGVVAVYDAADINPLCQPFVAVAQHRPGHRSPPQRLLVADTAVWQGQPVAVVIASTRAEAEDAAELVAMEWEELPVVASIADALRPDGPVVHPELGDNLAFDFRIERGEPDKAFAAADLVVEEEFRFERQTALTLEPRGLVAEFDPTERALIVHHAHQSPFQMQDVFCRHLGLPEHKVRVTAPDVGGAFGMKLNIYPDEIATVVAAMKLGRPVKFISDRLESFVSDAHARDHVVKARMALTRDGRITAMEVDDIGAVGAYGMPLRFNVAEGMMTITTTGAPYAFEAYRARTRSVYTNTCVIGMYRGVGMPLACVVAETLAGIAARRLDIDAADFKRRNLRTKASLPCVTPGGQRLETVSFHECLERILVLSRYDDLRREQAALRAKGVYRGLGLASFVEQTAYGPPYYGPSGAPISTQDGCTLRLEPSGVIRCVTSITDQGQGTLTAVAQIVASEVGVRAEDVGIIAGDSALSPYGGGAWASRGTAIGGEAALKAGRLLKRNILALAGAITQTPADNLDIAAGQIVNRGTGQEVISLAEIGRIGYFRQDTLPRDFDVQLSVTASYVANDKMGFVASGVQLCHVEVDAETGMVRVLGQWAVDDCGRVVNPLLVAEQVRGGIVQGIGAVLFEECAYDDNGSLLNGTMADYLVPMSCEMPDVVTALVETPEASTLLGAKGIGEAGLIGAMGAVWVAVNDALQPLGATIKHQPFTPERILEAIAAASPG